MSPKILICCSEVSSYNCGKRYTSAVCNNCGKKIGLPNANPKIQDRTHKQNAIHSRALISSLVNCANETEVQLLRSVDGANNAPFFQRSTHRIFDNEYGPKINLCRTEKRWSFGSVCVGFSEGKDSLQFACGALTPLPFPRYAMTPHFTLRVPQKLRQQTDTLLTPHSRSTYHRLRCSVVSLVCTLSTRSPPSFVWPTIKRI